MNRDLLGKLLMWFILCFAVMVTSMMVSAHFHHTRYVSYQWTITYEPSYNSDCPFNYFANPKHFACAD